VAIWREGCVALNGCGGRESCAARVAKPRPSDGVPHVILKASTSATSSPSCFSARKKPGPGRLLAPSRQRFGAATAGVSACKLVANAMGPATLESWCRRRWRRACGATVEGKIKANRCLLPSICLHVVFRTTFLEGALSLPKVANNSTLRPAPAPWDLNVVLYSASCPTWPETKPPTSAQEPVAFAIAAPGGRGRFSIRLWLLWPRRTAADCRHSCWAEDDVREAWGSAPRRDGAAGLAGARPRPINSSERPLTGCREGGCAASSLRPGSRA